MLLVPFRSNREHLIIHSVIVPFLYFHWITNNDTCALTELEKYISKKTKNEDTFIGSIISPIYKIEKEKCKRITKMVSLLLWCISFEKI